MDRVVSREDGWMGTARLRPTKVGYSSGYYGVFTFKLSRVASNTIVTDILSLAHLTSNTQHVIELIQVSRFYGMSSLYPM